LLGQATYLEIDGSLLDVIEDERPFPQDPFERADNVRVVS